MADTNETTDLETETAPNTQECWGHKIVNTNFKLLSYEEITLSENKLFFAFVLNKARWNSS